MGQKPRAPGTIHLLGAQGTCHTWFGSMIQIAVSIIDRLIMLLERRTASERRIFEDHIQPLFLDLTTIHEDYRNAFHEVSEVFRDRNVPAHRIAEKLQRRRLELEHLRAKIFAYTKAIESKVARKPRWLSEEGMAFLNSVQSYFETGVSESPTLYPVKGSTWFTSLLDLIYISNMNGTLTRPDCIQLADEMAQAIDRNWARVTIAYANLRIRCLK